MDMSNIGPQSPLEIKPDTATLLSYANGNRTGSPESPGLSQSSFGLPHNGFNQQCFPPNHPLSGSKHLCSICGDRASGKHYGVYSCEGCKGFFKRTVRKDLTYACREDRQCTIDKRHRNRCQYCRYQKCLEMGMKREAVQEERQRNRADRGENEVESTSGSIQYEMSVERIVEAEQRCDGRDDQLIAFENGNTDMIQASDKQLYYLVDWAKHIPHFAELPVEDQVTLLKGGWNELLIAGLAHRSIVLNDGIVLATGLVIDRRSAHSAGFEHIYDRVLVELVAKFREMRVDTAEVGCLRAIVLLNPDTKNLKSVEKVEKIREQIYITLEEYCRTAHPEEPGRFAKLLIRLPSLRSVGLKCLDYLFFFRMSSETSIEQFLTDILEAPIIES